MKAALNTVGFAHPPRNVGAFGIEHGMHIADFGAGSGAYILAIAKRLEQTGVVYAIDIQQDLLRRIKNEARHRGYTNVEVLWSDLEKPGASSIADRRLDIVLISNLLFQLEDKKTPLLEAWRTLKPLGKLIIVDWSESFGGMGPTKASVVKKETALMLARECGFEFVKEFEAGAHHYGLVFRPVARRV